MTTLQTRPELTVTQLAGRIGAVIDGVDLAGDLDAPTVAALRAAILRHKTVFFRDQHAFDDDAQVALADRLGEATKAHPTVNTGSEKVLSVAAAKGMAANSWHTDVTFVDRIPALSILRGVTIPAYGGDTQWANTVAAYDRLPPVLQAFAEDLWAVHTNDYDYAAESENVVKPIDDDVVFKREDFGRVRYETAHPVVRVHPETGEKALLLGHFVKRFVGLNTAESHAVFHLLQARITRAENVVRWSWRQGDVAVWDNRATQHYAVADFGEQFREVRRVTVAGDVPVSVDGRRSQVIEGDAASFSQISALVR